MIGCYLNVCLLYIVTVIVECMSQYYWSVKERMNDKHCWHVMYDFMVNLLSYSISGIVAPVVKQLRTRLCCAYIVARSCTPIAQAIESILLSLYSALVMCVRTIIPHQLQKHGSGSYTLRYLGWDCACIAGVVDWACSVELMSLGVLFVLCCSWTLVA